MTNSLSQDGQARNLASGRRSVSVHELHRRARGLSITDLAAAAGLDRSLVSRVERGQRRPTAAYRAAVSEALGVAEHELFPEDETAEPGR